MFNGTDLPVQPYLQLVAANNIPTYGDLVSVLGPVLALTTWAVAPDAKTERQALTQLAGEGAICPGDARVPAVQSARQRAYSAARTELQAATQRRRAARARLGTGPQFFALEDVGGAIIEALPPTYAEFRSTRAAPSPSTSPFKALVKTPGSAIDFVLEMFQYRYTSFARYLDDFESSSGRRVDLTVSAMVDYDWWLNGGHPTETSLAEQVDLMAELVVATAGRLHYWVPFCPYREAQFRNKPGSTFSSLHLAQRAVRECGAIGVKLYPPMGFAALGNEQHVDPKVWQSATWLSGLADSPTFGHELDVSMQSLYDWCGSEDVPILAHANTSSAPSKEFAALAGPDYWDYALQYRPDLRVVFGHFGGAQDQQDLKNAQHFIRLMGPGTGSGANTSADVSYFDKVISDPNDPQQALLTLLASESDPAGVLSKRLLFGSDWKMLLLEAGADQYLKAFIEVFNAIAQAPPAGISLPDFGANALGRNAITALGLHVNGRSRRRVESFYAVRGIHTPAWMHAADAVI